MILLRKKYILVVILGGMLVAAGYINYKTKPVDVSKEEVQSLGEADYVINLKEEVDTLNKDNITGISDAYFVSARLEREEQYNKNIAQQKEILYNKELDSNTLKTAQDALNKTLSKMELETEIEALIGAKGFSDVLAVINEDSADIIVKTQEELSVSEAAQIQSIVMRKADKKAEDIHIITKK